MAHMTSTKEGTKESIVKYDVPISTTPAVDKYGNKVQSAHENVSKVEEMLYAMIPPRYQAILCLHVSSTLQSYDLFLSGSGATVMENPGNNVQAKSPRQDLM